MQLSRKIAEDTYYVGSSDRRLALFENIYPIERGVSYNSYVVLDEKTVLLDTVDHSVSRQFMENLEGVLDGRSLDYLIVNHVEPDHCATIDVVVKRYPGCKIVGNAKTLQFIGQYYDFDLEGCSVTVKEGETLETGKHSFTFVLAPMVHWPEVMVSYDSYTKVLFSADAFGTFGALSGNLFADEVEFEKEWLDDARRYYINIVGKYGVQTLNVLKKAQGLEISMIAPLHGPIWRENIGWFIDKYRRWASYEAEEDGIVIIYSSIYGNTEQAMNYLSYALSDRNVRNIHMYDASKTDPSVLLSECFRYSKAVFASSTYNLEIFPRMENLMSDLKAHLYQNRKVGVVENGTWALQSGKKMVEWLSSMKNIEIIGGKAVSILSNAKGDVLTELDKLADELVK